MAFLIFERLGLKSRIFTPDFEVWPAFKKVAELGEVYLLKYKRHNIVDVDFLIEIECPIDEYEAFIQGILTDSDIVYTNPSHGDIVERPKGNIYVGRLFVCKFENLSKAYNLLPSNTPLDRDREVPRSFDVSYHASRLNELHGKWTANDISYNDFMFVSDIPESIINDFAPKQIGDSVEFVVKDDTGKDTVVTNSHVREALFKLPTFKDVINRIKASIFKSVGILDLLEGFKAKYIQAGSEQERDFDVIIERFK